MSNKNKFKITPPKKRPHKMLFDEDTPFKMKVVPGNKRTVYKRKPKNQRDQGDLE